ncbi:hypothetical protein CXF72_02720 [Psychromonas sp. MB-3u-54]|nr:hypothetical protein CXF72_02720 [Psychromonas sp. MB-3u-54]
MPFASSQLPYSYPRVRHYTVVSSLLFLSKGLQVSFKLMAEVDAGLDNEVMAGKYCSGVD